MKAAAFAALALGAGVAGWPVVAIPSLAVAAIVLARARIVSTRALVNDPAARGLVQAAGGRVDPVALPPANLVTRND